MMPRGGGLRGVDAQRQDPVPTADVEIAPRNENEEEPGLSIHENPVACRLGLVNCRRDWYNPAVGRPGGGGDGHRRRSGVSSLSKTSYRDQTAVNQNICRSGRCD